MNVTNTSHKRLDTYHTSEQMEKEWWDSIEKMSHEIENKENIPLKEHLKIIEDLHTRSQQLYDHVRENSKDALGKISLGHAKDAECRINGCRGGLATPDLIYSHLLRTHFQALTEIKKVGEKPIKLTVSYKTGTGRLKEQIKEQEKNGAKQLALLEKDDRKKTASATSPKKVITKTPQRPTIIGIKPRNLLNDTPKNESGSGSLQRRPSFTSEISGNISSLGALPFSKEFEEEENKLEKVNKKRSFDQMSASSSQTIGQPSLSNLTQTNLFSDEDSLVSSLGLYPEGSMELFKYQKSPTEEYKKELLKALQGDTQLNKMILEDPFFKSAEGIKSNTTPRVSSGTIHRVGGKLKKNNKTNLFDSVIKCSFWLNAQYLCSHCNGQKFDDLRELLAHTGSSAHKKQYDTFIKK